MHTLFFFSKNVNNFQSEHKTCSFFYEVQFPPKEIVNNFLLTTMKPQKPRSKRQGASMGPIIRIISAQLGCSNKPSRCISKFLTFGSVAQLHIIAATARPIVRGHGPVELIKPHVRPGDLRVRTVAKRHMRSSMFTASFILVSGVKLP